MSAREEIRDITKIDIWFLHKLNNLAKIEKELAKGFDNELYLKAKKLGSEKKSQRRQPSSDD